MRHRRNRHQKGSVGLDPRINIWYFRYYDDNRERQVERIGTKKEYPTKSKAEEAAKAIRDRVFGVKKAAPEAITLDRVADRYVKERMPVRHTTSRGYKGKLKIIRAKWGQNAMPLNPNEVEPWLEELKSTKGTLYSKKSRRHLRNMLALLHKAAMFFGYYPTTTNPMKLVEIRTMRGAPKSKPRIVLSRDEFRLLLARFAGMYRVMIMLAGGVGLRRSEIFGLKWLDFNWVKNEILIQRSHVEGYEDETKTESSNALVPLHPAIVEALLAWRQQSQFNMDDDYVFASPTMMGKKPLNANSVQRDYLRPESVKAGLKPLGWHALRHSYRTWLAENKTGSAAGFDAAYHDWHVAGRLRARHTGVEQGSELCRGQSPFAVKPVNGLITGCVGFSVL
jgi:integrase